MTKEQYLFLLRAELDGFMSAEELEDILQYYNEYFAEAGPEQEREVMLELGSPQRLAEKILEQRSAEAGSFETPESYGPTDGYYGGHNQFPKWVVAIWLGIVGLVVFPTMGGLILGFGLIGLGCVIGGVIAVLVGSFSFGLAGKLYVVGGGMVAFSVGLLLLLAAGELIRLTVQFARYCGARFGEGGAVYDEAGY